ncbi:MAG: 4'-phosphopantetheinyl transferase superfamily protein [Lawsonella sp.]
MIDLSADIGADEILQSVWDQYPETVCCAELGDISEDQAHRDFDALAESEKTLIEHAVAGRQQEFSATRRLAHNALDALGYSNFALLRDDNGAPQWPTSVFGAITHCAGFRAVVVSTALPALGIDAEPAHPLPQGVLESISSAAERAQIRECEFSIPLDTVLFSVKETIYKTWYPLTHAWLGFADANVQLTVQELVSDASELRVRGSFQATLDPQKIETNKAKNPLVARMKTLSGHWFIASGVVVTTCSLTAS